MGSIPVAGAKRQRGAPRPSAFWRSHLRTVQSRHVGRGLAPAAKPNAITPPNGDGGIVSFRTVEDACPYVEIEKGLFLLFSALD